MYRAETALKRSRTETDGYLLQLPKSMTRIEHVLHSPRVGPVDVPGLVFFLEVLVPAALLVARGEGGRAAALPHALREQRGDVGEAEGRAPGARLALAALPAFGPSGGPNAEIVPSIDFYTLPIGVFAFGK